MEVVQLKYFVTIAETRSFTQAANKLHVSQPALSYQIKRLENELGARLFERTSRTVALTTDGQVFLPLAQDILARVNDAQRVMHERLGAERGEVTFGTLPSVGAYVVPPLLASFRRNFPGIKVRLVETGSNLLEKGVLDGDIDLAIVGVPRTPTGLEVTPLIVEELVLLLPAKHERAKRTTIRLRDLENEDFILLGGMYFTFVDLVVEACHRNGFEPKIAYETGSLESVKSFVAHGLGISVLPRLALGGPKDDSIVVIPFDEPITRDLNLIRAKQRYASVATRALMVHIRTSILQAISLATKPLAYR